MTEPNSDAILRALADGPKDLFQLERICERGLMPALKLMNESGLISCIWSRFAITSDGRRRVGLPAKAVRV